MAVAFSRFCEVCPEEEKVRANSWRRENSLRPTKVDLNEASFRAFRSQVMDAWRNVLRHALSREQLRPEKCCLLGRALSLSIQWNSV